MYMYYVPRVVEVMELWRVDEGQVEPRVVILHLEVEPAEPSPREIEINCRG